MTKDVHSAEQLAKVVAWLAPLRKSTGLKVQHLDLVHGALHQSLPDGPQSWVYRVGAWGGAVADCFVAHEEQGHHDVFFEASPASYQYLRRLPFFGVERFCAGIQVPFPELASKIEEERRACVAMEKDPAQRFVSGLRGEARVEFSAKRVLDTLAARVGEPEHCLEELWVLLNGVVESADMPGMSAFQKRRVAVNLWLFDAVDSGLAKKWHMGQAANASPRWSPDFNERDTHVFDLVNGLVSFSSSASQDARTSAREVFDILQEQPLRIWDEVEY